MQKDKYPTLSTLIIPMLMALFLTVPYLAMADILNSSSESFSKKGVNDFVSGRFENTIPSLKKESLQFAKEGRIADQADTLIQLAAAYRKIGQDDLAAYTLEEALPLSKKTKSRKNIAKIMSSLGLLHVQGVVLASSPDSGRVVGNLESTSRSVKITRNNVGEIYLKEALSLAEEENDPALLASVLNNTGIMYATRDNFDDAMLVFKQALTYSDRLNNKVMAANVSSNYASLAIKRKDYIQAGALADAALKLFRSLEMSDEKTGGLITIGQTYRRLAVLVPDLVTQYRLQARNAFTEAVELAGLSKDNRSVSFALGYLGQLKEEQKEFDEALHLTRRALFAAQQVNAKELLSLWEWQLGRILRLKGETENAVAAYRQSILNLQSVKQNLYTGCAYSPLSYKENIEPVYKGLSDLLLQKSFEAKDSKAAGQYLFEARQTVEDLKIAEMQDYLKNTCFEGRSTKFKSADTLSVNTAIIYMISFAGRIELLVSLPDGIKRITIPNPGDVITGHVKSFRISLTDLSDSYMAYSKSLYDSLIRPLEPELHRHKINTLVIIPDDIFRTVPFAALHDGNDFLINKYAIATSLGMQLTEPMPFRKKKVTMLAAGISESVHGYSALPSVSNEMTEIKSLFDGEMLFNKDFSVANLKEKVEAKKYSILHLASHGEFSNDAKKSFIVAWDSQMSIDQFGGLVKVTQYKDEPLDLITLSACKTAVGDDKAVLGLAGVAIKSGASSALATLWEVDDKATSELVVEFYRQLKKPTHTKAQALQKAQIAALQHHKHPYYWSPFLLIGNWL
ncbi:MAG: CHAT domain-containing protein [Desulfuromonadaceae bacterium]